MATISMDRVKQLVRESAQRVGGRTGFDFGASATFDNDTLKVTALITTRSTDGMEKPDAFYLSGSNLRLGEAALSRLLDDGFDRMAKRYWNVR